MFAAVMLGGMTLMTTQLSRIIRAEVGRVEGVLSARIESIDRRLEELDTELTNLATRFWRSQ
ncbi:hypothetical protein [Microbacterium oxydans]|uniref:hypothetical protein n=1 Tax=Microbacterium oxydans TaxID=82380 RepID=UPI001E5B9044|nr:hypothetical protein [Microbacterium oxydans]